MLRFFFVVMVTCLMVGVCRGQASGDEQSIRTLLEVQAAAWNRGDVDAFMEAYEESAETAYVGEEMVQGYDAILAGYQKRYPDRSRMGRLTFSELHVRIAADRIAIVVGRFALERAQEHGGPASGIFTLVMRKSEAGWKIIHDHTS